MNTTFVHFRIACHLVPRDMIYEFTIGLRFLRCSYECWNYYTWKQRNHREYGCGTHLTHIWQYSEYYTSSSIIHRLLKTKSCHIINHLNQRDKSTLRANEESGSECWRELCAQKRQRYFICCVLSLSCSMESSQHSKHHAHRWQKKTPHLSA